jgi:hypothetical protein
MAKDKLEVVVEYHTPLFMLFLAALGNEHTNVMSK